MKQKFFRTDIPDDYKLTSEEVQININCCLTGVLLYCLFILAGKIL